MAYTRRTNEDQDEGAVTEEVIPRYRLYVGCPTYNKPDTMFSMDTGWPLMFHLGRRHPEIKEVMVQRDVRTYRQEARNNIVKEALAHNFTHLLMLDDDMVFDPEVFDKVWQVCLESEKPALVSALYFTRGYPLTAPCMFRLTSQGTVPLFEYPENAVISEKDGVEVVGFGMLLFDMRIFEAVPPPWFNLGIGFGEDAAFCTRVRQSGFEIKVHTGAKVGHIHEDPTLITEQTYLACKQYLAQGGQYEEGQLVRISSTGDGSGTKDGRAHPQNTLESRTGWRGSPTKLLRGFFAGRSRNADDLVGAGAGSTGGDSAQGNGASQ